MVAPSGHGPEATPRLAPDTYTPKHLAEKILTSKAALEGERKQVTVLFADLKGSMELLADRDPEEARTILDPVLEHMMEAVHRYEGTVNQVMGDGIMALFGAPLAHEDHAVRACYAALRMQESVKRYAEGVFRTSGVPVRIRVGLNSGEVVVRAIGSDLHMDYTAVGQTTHLAARMEQIADPGTIRLTADTLHLAEGFVQVQPLGPTPVKGLAAPVEVYELTAASPVRSRLQATAARGLTKFVGRDAEIETLFGGLRQAQAGHGQVVAIVGEPGVGKSRLVWEFTHSHRTQGCLVLEASSLSYGKATTYLPVIELLKRYFTIEPRDDARKIREKVTGKLFSLDRTLEPCLASLLWLLDAPAADAEWDRLDPVLRRQRLHESLRRLLLRDAREQPLVCVFEDLHWIDRETQALLDGLVESLPTARVLLLVNYRPEYQHGWGSKTYYTQVRLDPLPATSATELLAALLGPDASVLPLVPMLITRTEGNPFFLEETVQSLVEAGALSGERGAYRLVRAPAALNIPATARAILAARIDRLAPEDKRLLQTAAVIGKDIPYPLLRAIAELDESALRAGLARLQAAEFVYEVQLFPELEYTLKHALTHEVAYRSLLHDRRRALHARIVGVIERLAADRLAEQSERLAHHAFRGEEWGRAVGYLRQAGLRSAARAAHREAADHFEQALEAVRHLPEERGTAEAAIDLRLELRTALFPLGESERMLRATREAEALAAALGDQHRLARVSNSLVIQALFARDYGEALRFGQRSLEIARALGDLAIEATANAYLGMAHLDRGELSQAIGCAQHNVDRLTGDLLHQRFGQAVIVSAASRWVLAMSLSELGRFVEAISCAEEAARIAEDAGQRYTLAGTLLMLGCIHAASGDFPRAIAVLDRGLELARTLQFLVVLPAMVAVLGYVLGHVGRAGEALRLVEEAAKGLASQWRSIILPEQHFVRVGAAYLLADRMDDASDWARKALEVCQRHGARGSEAHALHLLGEIAIRRAPPEVAEAESRYGQALTLAEELGMRPLVAHCHAGLAVLGRRTCTWPEALEHLTIATTMYRDMGMTYWLEDAKRN